MKYIHQAKGRFEQTESKSGTPEMGCRLLFIDAQVC